VSRKNEAVNRIVQGSVLYASLNSYQRKVLVLLLKRAYEVGAEHESEATS
jgi:hypothetical protein